MSSSPSPTPGEAAFAPVAWAMWKRFLLAGVLIVVVSAAATATAGLEKVTSVAAEVFPRTQQIRPPTGVITSSYDGGPETFLLIGSDKRAGSKGVDRRDPPHSDTLLLVRMDPTQGQTSVLSVPRDLLVSITAPGGRVVYPAKINEAYSLGSLAHGNDGGAQLAAETLKHLLGIQINGIVDVTFGGFTDVVDALGGVYVNVDHRYFHQNLGASDPTSNYSSINLEPGYQLLSYTNALDYVRYRHTDSDFVRVARQQDFIRSLREQISPTNLLDQIDRVSLAVGRAITTTFSSSAAELIRLSKLIVYAQQKPLRQVKFRFISDNTFIGSTSYVTTSSSLLQATVNDFINGAQRVALPRPAASAPPGGSHHHPAAGASGGSRDLSPAASFLFPSSPGGRDQAIAAATGIPFPVLYPAYQTATAIQQTVRPYALRDRQGHLHRAYVEVWQQNAQGGYYDVQGMDWLNPPIIAHPSSTRTIGGRHYMFIDDGNSIHLIAWRQNGALYWINNTLREELSNRQMLILAEQTQRLR